MRIRQQAREAQAERLKEITDKLEEGIKGLFESSRYREYLQTMSKFHRYSFGNSLLILVQKPGASYVAGYNDWKKKFGRHVKKGETGITILAPCTFRAKEEVEEVQPNGEKVITEQWVERRSYRTVTVFDISQTEGPDLPQIASMLDGSVEQYQAVLAALREVSPVPIDFQPLPDTANGCYNHMARRITIRPDMSEVQTIKTTIHEIAHSKLHDYAIGSQNRTDGAIKDRHTREVEAESVAYVVCQHFGIDTSDYSFGYVAGWSKNRELAELKASLECIRNTASEIIDGIVEHCPELTQTSTKGGKTAPPKNHRSLQSSPTR